MGRKWRLMLNGYRHDVSEQRSGRAVSRGERAGTALQRRASGEAGTMV